MPIFFLLFLNIEREGWGLLFEVTYHLGWSGGGPNGQNCPNFIRGDPVGSSRKEKILTKIGDKLDMLQTAFWLFFCWDILVAARYVVGTKSAKRASNGLSLQTPASDRVNLRYIFQRFSTLLTTLTTPWPRNYSFMTTLIKESDQNCDVRTVLSSCNV